MEGDCQLGQRSSSYEQQRQQLFLIPHPPPSLLQGGVYDTLAMAVFSPCPSSQTLFFEDLGATRIKQELIIELFHIYLIYEKIPETIIELLLLMQGQKTKESLITLLSLLAQVMFFIAELPPFKIFCLIFLFFHHPGFHHYLFPVP